MTGPVGPVVSVWVPGEWCGWNAYLAMVRGDGHWRGQGGQGRGRADRLVEAIRISAGVVARSSARVTAPCVLAVVVYGRLVRDSDSSGWIGKPVLDGLTDAGVVQEVDVQGVVTRYVAGSGEPGASVCLWLASADPFWSSVLGSSEGGA